MKPLTATAAKRNVALKINKDNVVQVTVDAKRAERKESDGTDAYVITAKVPMGTTGIRIDALKEKSAGIGLASNGNFVLSEIVITNAAQAKLALAHASATFEQGGFAAPGAIDGILDKRDNGWAVMGGSDVAQSLYLEFAEPLAEADATLTFTLTCGWGENHLLANVRLNATAAPKPIRSPGASSPVKDVAELLALSADKRTPEQQQKLLTAFKKVAPELNDLRTRIDVAEKAKADFMSAAPKCLVSVSDKNRRTVRILPRGDWMKETGEVMKPALPGYLSKPAIDGRELTRLDLAQWLVSRDNPLTARTVMNRMWKQFFGIGQSKVLDDLGAQGEPPTNPAVLDWLACEFMDSGWDVKHMVRAIVTSQTYRQVSTASAALQASDPYNRFTARQSAFRLDAELVRDQALAVSGLLVRAIGGPSVKPYQPDGYWENLNFPQRTYPSDRGDAQYRRGVYTWWQRSFMHPSMLAFDAPSREECTAERTRSNIPQQALVLLNDPTYVEAARTFAARILSEAKGSPEQRIGWAWRQALQREPSAEELRTVQTLFAERLAAYQADKGAADALLKVGFAQSPATLDRSELAAWTHVARILLNLHETITRS